MNQSLFKANHNNLPFLWRLTLGIVTSFIVGLTISAFNLSKEAARQYAMEDAQAIKRALEQRIQHDTSLSKISALNWSDLPGEQAIQNAQISLVTNAGQNPAINQHLTSYQSGASATPFLWQTIDMVEPEWRDLATGDATLHFQLTVTHPVNFPWLAAAISVIAIVVLLINLRKSTATGALQKGQTSEKSEPTSTIPSSPESAASEAPLPSISPSSHSSHLSQSEEQIVQSELELSQQSAIEANRFKSQLMSNTSHELLTPLNSILGFSQLLQNKYEVKQQHEPLTTDDADTLRKLNLVVHNAEHLNSLVNDLVVVANESHHRLPLQHREINVDDFIRSISDSLVHEVRNKQLALHCHLKDIEGLQLWSDPVRLRQILYNLVVNAIRYTDEGEITISAITQNIGSGEELVIKVSDTGRGIEASKKSLLFKTLVSESSSDHDKDLSMAEGPGLGLGLGLSIVLSLTKMLGGHVTLDSEVGKGSTFSIHLPVRRNLIPNALSTREQKSTHQSILSSAQDKAVELLVVDDNPSNALLINEQLKNTRCAITICHTGKEALQRAEKKSFDAVLLDIRMQPMDGYQVYRALKQLEQFSETPIFACTAHTSESEHQNLLQFGFARVIKKPVNRDELMALLHLHEQTREQTHEEMPSVELESGIALEASSKASETFFDPALALQKSANNADVAQRIFELLLTDLEEKLQHFRSGSLGEAETLLDLIHQINGAAALSGTRKLRRIANEIETRIKEEGEDSVQSDVKALFNYIESLLGWAKKTQLDTLFLPIVSTGNDNR